MIDGQLSMDDLTYQYPKGASGNKLNNRLRYVHDQVATGNYAEDIDNQAAAGMTQQDVLDEKLSAQVTDNYQYDAIGNLVSDNKENITNIEWTVYGKIKKITKTATADGDVTSITYTYDVAGNRISKKVEKQNQAEKYTWYVSDASGNVMAVYEASGSNLSLSEQHIYGSSRLGVWNRNIDMAVSPNANNYNFTRGNKFFELSNHLGNVLVTVPDKKIGHDAGNSTIDYYHADVVTANDYYPEGMQMPGRSINSSSYRYGAASGQEKSLEINENSYTAEFWQYDARLSRRWNQDPKPNPSLSNYSAFANSPIFTIDVLGDTTYRFNQSDGSYIGMFDIEVTGSVGSYGDYKTIGEGLSAWSGTQFEFADPAADAQQIRDGIIDRLVFVSNDKMKSMLTAQGAFNPDNSYLWDFYQASKGGGDFDYSYKSIPQTFPGASESPLATPSPMLFLPEGDRMAHNHMNFGNYLWAASGYTLGFGYGQLQSAAHANSRIDPGRANGYEGQWDSADDQRSIIQGAYHADRYKYRNILKARNPNKAGAPWSGLWKLF